MMVKLEPLCVCVVPLHQVAGHDVHFWPLKRKPRASTKRGSKHDKESVAVAAPASSSPASETFVNVVSEEDMTDISDEETAGLLDLDGQDDAGSQIDLLLWSEAMDDALVHVASDMNLVPSVEELAKDVAANSSGTALAEATLVTEPAPKQEMAASSSSRREGPAPPITDGSLMQPVVPELEGDALTREPARLGLRGMADSTHYVAGGRISFYSSKNAFEAICSNPAHGKPGTCNMTRTCRGRIKNGEETAVAGRPIGFLAMWLSIAGDTATKEDHKSRARLASFSMEQRQRARTAFISTGLGMEVASFERGRIGDEPEEPLELTGLL
eukprot:6154355-Amphidinium_carterae.2